MFNRIATFSGAILAMAEAKDPFFMAGCRIEAAADGDVTGMIKMKQLGTYGEESQAVRVSAKANNLPAAEVSLDIYDSDPKDETTGAQVEYELGKWFRGRKDAA